MPLLDNRYATIELSIPADLRDRINSLVMQAGHSQYSVFDRQIDLWWTGIIIGIALKKRTPNTMDMHHFNAGAILSSDPWRVMHLELIALAEEGEKALESPRNVIQIASEYSNTGVRWLVEQLASEPEPILTFANIIKEFYKNEES